MMYLDDFIGSPYPLEVNIKEKIISKLRIAQKEARHRSHSNWKKNSFLWFQSGAYSLNHLGI